MLRNEPRAPGGEGVQHDTDGFAPAQPYRGIRAFRYADDEIFFGRDEESERLTSLVMVYRGVVLYGASGTGKSSLINAGLLPRVAHALSPERIRLRPDPGQEVVIERIETDDVSRRLLPSTFVDGQEDAGRAVMSLSAFEGRVRAAHSETRPLLIFDQFEEILTLFDERNAAGLRADIVAVLVKLLREPIPIKFVFSLREEYLGRVTELLASCPELVDQSLRLGPPGADALPRIIRGPFDRFPGHYAHEVSAALAGRLREAFVERSGPGEVSLSVVQTVCLRIWESDDPDALLADRGVQGILEDYLGATLERMPANVKAAAIALLSEMITSAGTRAVVSHEELMNRVAPKNIHARRVYERALGQLVDESRLVRREPRRGTFLYELTSEFLVPWISKRREELERHRRTVRERRIFFTATAIAVVALIVAGLGIWAVIEKNNLDQKTVEATYNGLAASAANELAGRPDVSMLLLLAALQTSPLPRAEDSLLATFEAAQREGVIGILHGHTDAVESLTFNPARQVFASGSADGTIRLWSASQHRELGQPILQRGVVFSVAVNGAGTMLAGGRFGQIRLWNVSTHRLQESLAAAHGGAVSGLAFRPGHDQTLAAGTLSGTLQLWNLATQRALDLRSGVGPIRSVAFSPDGGILVASGNGGVQLFDAVTGDPLGRAAESFPGRTKYSVAFSPNGAMIATGANTAITLWTRTPFRPIGTIATGSGIVHSLAFASDGLLVSGGDDGTVRLWNVTTRQEVGTPLIGHVGAVDGVAVAARQATLASAGADDTIRLWSMPVAEGLASGSANNTRSLIVHHGVVRGIAFSPDGRTIASADLNGVIDLSDVATGRLLATPRLEPRGVLGVAFSPDGQTLAAAEANGRVALWSPLRGQYALLSTGDRKAVFSVAFDPTGRILAAGGADGLVHLWDFRRRLPAGHPLAGHTGPVYSVAFNPSGTLLASGSDDRTIRVWNVASESQVGEPMVSPNAVFSVTFSPHAGRVLASGGADGTLRLWNVATRQEIGQPLSGHTSLVRSVAFSPDGRLVASGSSDQTVRLWDVATASQLGAALTGSHGGVETVAFSPDGTLATSGVDGTVRFWGGVAAPAYGRLRQRVCRFLGGGLSPTEWSLYAGNVPYQPTCSGVVPSAG